MDIQESTAPLMRQIQSAEKQARVRAAAWAEVEAKLRSELEQSVIEQEKISKDRTELKLHIEKLERTIKEKEDELAEAQSKIERLTAEVNRLNEELDNMECEKDEWVEVKKLASEDVAKAKSDMMKTVVDNEERYRARIDALEDQLEAEKAKRLESEESLENLVNSTYGFDMRAPHTSRKVRKPPKEERKKLKATEDQAEILQSTISGLGGDEDDGPTDGLSEIPLADNPGLGSFAAVEQLSQGLKAARTEIDTLRVSFFGAENFVAF